MSEERLGSALSKLPAEVCSRTRVFTKVGRLVRGDVVVNDFTGEGARASLLESLSRLGLAAVHSLRIHDPNDSPERPPEVDEVGVALGPGGMVEALVAMRTSGTISQVSLRMNSNVERGPGREFALPPSLTAGRPAEIERLVAAAPAGTFDDALLAGGWTLLTQAALPAMVACQQRGVPVAVAGIFATGLLTDCPKVSPQVGKVTYAYQAASEELVARASRWRELAAEHQLSLSAVAIAFAYLPTVVHRVVIGCATAHEVSANIEAVRLSASVPPSLWHQARARGLLGPEVPLPVDMRIVKIKCGVSRVVQYK